MVRIRLTSWNLHGPPLAPRRAARFERAAAEILAEPDPVDLVLLQEVWFARDAERLRRRFAGVYDPLDGAPRAWPLRAGGLLAFLRRDGAWRIAPAPARFERFASGAPAWRVWEGDTLAGKGVQIVELRHVASEQTLIVLNTHLQAQYGPIRHEPARRAQLQQLGALAERLDPSLPVLAAGDFNTGPEEPLYDELLARHWHDLTIDARTEGHPAATQFECGPEPLWIDYVLARRNADWSATASLELIRNVARDEPFSDHHGLRADIVITRG
jgi:endonuclease/exonuclease/phosphatase family metal-dependent hydrolase